MKKRLINALLIAVGMLFLWSCAAVEKQTQKETKEQPSAPPPVSEEAKPRPKEVPPEVKEHPKKAPVVHPKHPEPKPAAPKEPEPKPAVKEKVSTQQKYYNMGMRFYAQEKYLEAKHAWKRVIKLGRKTDLAEKARENIKKVDQILKTLKEISGK